MLHDLGCWSFATARIFWFAFWFPRTRLLLPFVPARRIGLVDVEKGTARRQILYVGTNDISFQIMFVFIRYLR